MHPQLRLRLILLLLLLTPIYVACQLFAGAYASSGGQQLGGNQATLNSIQLSVDNANPSVGGSTTCGASGAAVACFTATGFYSDGNNRPLTGLSGAQLTSSNTSVLTVQAQATPWPTLATTTGTSNVTFSYAGVTSNPVAVTVSVVVIVTTTTLPNAQVGVAYSTTLSASGGTAPYTWSYTGCPTGIALACNTSTGVISGTPTGNAGTPYSITVQATDSASHTSQPTTFQLTVLPAAGACGFSATPPFNCSTHSAATAPQVGSTNLPLPNVGGLVGTNTVVWPCKVPTAPCVSTDFYAPTSLTGNGITRLSDSVTYNNRSCFASISAGANEYNVDTSGQFMRVSCNGVYPVMPLGVNGSGYIINGAAGGGNLAANSITIDQWGMASTTTAGRFWGAHSSSSANTVNLVRYDVSISSGSANLGTATVCAGAACTGTNNTPTVVANWLQCPGIPNPFPLSGKVPSAATEMTPSYGDTVVSWGIGDGSGGTGQGTGNWLLVYAVSGPHAGQCTSLLTAATTVNTINNSGGQYWTWCTLGSCPQNGATPTGTVPAASICPNGLAPTGMHNSNVMLDGNYVMFSENCGGSASYEHAWQIATGNAVANPIDFGHTGNGYDNVYTCGPGNNRNALINIPNAFSSGWVESVFWQWAVHFPSPQDCHGRAMVANVDTNPLWAVHEEQAGSGSVPYASEVVAYSPSYPSNCAASNTCLASRIGPTYSAWTLANTYFGSQYPVGLPSQNNSGVGFGIFFASNWASDNVPAPVGTLGTDQTGKPRTDIFVYSQIQ